MVSSSTQDTPSWVTGASSSSSSSKMFKEGGGGDDSSAQTNVSNFKLGFPERAFSAAGAAFISAIIVNPLDVAKTRLQAQAAGVPYQGLCRMACFETNTMIPDMRCFPPRKPLVTGVSPACGPECSKYEGTLDVFYKVIRQEGFARLWRGTYASLALAIPTVGIYLPCYDIFRNFMEEFTSENAPSMTPYVPLVAGSIARTLACVMCYPVELARTRMQHYQITVSCGRA